MEYPTGYLKNTATGRFHPISFRRAPMPGGSDNGENVQRYKSLGHHTDGFPTIEEAREFVASYAAGDERMADCGLVWEWDGQDIPAMVEWFRK